MINGKEVFGTIEIYHSKEWKPYHIISKLLGLCFMAARESWLLHRFSTLHIMDGIMCNKLILRFSNDGLLKTMNKPIS